MVSKSPQGKVGRQRPIFRHLARKMVIQASLIALAAILSISFASVVIQQLLFRAALEREAVHFWKNYQLDSKFPLPNTANLRGYLVNVDSSQGLPIEVAGAELGFSELDDLYQHALLYATEKEGKRLYLVFGSNSVWRLSIFFGMVPLMIVLILIYSVAWWLYRKSSHVLSPIVWLANKFDRFDPAHPNSNISDLEQIPGDRDWEVETLVRSLSKYSKRIKHFVERERAFTRDASHEFRTPLTVIKMASDLLLAEPNLDDYARNYGQRIQGSARDMEELIDAFLILARETDNEFEDEPVLVSDVVAYEVDAAKIYNVEKELSINVIELHPLQLTTARKVLCIVLGNLIRNAMLYTNEGGVTITISKKAVTVSDTGVGMSADQTRKIFRPYYRGQQNDGQERQGYGVGLTIVKRLSSRFDWDIAVESEVGQGTTFTLSFNASFNE